MCLDTGTSCNTDSNTFPGWNKTTKSYTILYQATAEKTDLRILIQPTKSTTNHTTTANTNSEAATTTTNTSKETKFSENASISSKSVQF